MLQGLPRGRETELFAQDLLDRLPSTNGSARPSQNQLRERQVLMLRPLQHLLSEVLALCECSCAGLAI